ncbi:MAG: magnesium transporter [Deltaproteobacteria bacterium GWA2_55_10]|nr:MAG: magnesium transporter [Deltaproteobacteria bacterium GWA2_55_10]
MVVEVKHDHTEEVKNYLEANREEDIARLLEELHSSDIGRLLMSLEDEEAMRVFKLLSPEQASAVLLEVDERLRKALISSITSEELIEVVHEMETDDAADVISELPVEDAKQVLEGIDRHEAIAVQKLLVYPEDTAGGKMQAELVSVHETATIEETIEEVRKKAEEIENISNVFVVDRDGRLVGSVSLDKLILARPKTRIIEITNREALHVTTDMDQEEVAKLFQKYDLISMPVVDHEGRLVGRITIDDVVDVLEEEIFEDFYKMAGLHTEARALDPPLRAIRMRVPWLFLNLATALVAASVVKLFEGAIAQLVLLAVLMPIVAGMGGNAATQTITVVVRALALGEINFKNARGVLLKEVLVGFCNGFLTGGTAGFIAYLLGANPIVGLLLFLAMIANMMIAGLIGTIMPLVLKRFNFDPAISSSIFVTASTDVGGFFTFLGLATIFMKMGLL